MDDFLGRYDSLEDKNAKILEAIDDGYKNSEIARYLGLSSAGISCIIRGSGK